MACGCPVITSSGSGTEEAAGEAAVLLDPLNLLELTNAIKEAIEERTSLRNQRSLRGISHARNFSWKTTQELTSKVFEGFLVT